MPAAACLSALQEPLHRRHDHCSSKCKQYRTGAGCLRICHCDPGSHRELIDGRQSGIHGLDAARVRHIRGLVRENWVAAAGSAVQVASGIDPNDEFRQPSRRAVEDREQWQRGGSGR